MTETELKRLGQFGCALPVIWLVSLFVWSLIVHRSDESKNEVARIEYARLCSARFLLDEQNYKKWNSLKEDIISKKINFVELKIKVDDYDGPFEKYQNLLGQLESFDVNERLFRQKIHLLRNGREILQFSDLIVVFPRKSPLWGFSLALDFTSRSCYSDVDEFDKIINYHQN